MHRERNSTYQNLRIIADPTNKAAFGFAIPQLKEPIAERFWGFLSKFESWKVWESLKIHLI